jgi:outer membrane protein insertion porin family
LTLDSEPRGAAVRVDGLTLGATPCELFVPEGGRLVELVLPGFTPFREEIAVPGGVFASLLFPRRIHVFGTLETPKPLDAVILGAAEYVRWSFTGEPTAAYQIPQDLSEGVYRAGPAAADPALREENNMWTPKNSLWTSLSLDQRDIYYDPSEGYYGIERFGVYGILPNEREHYLRSDTKAEYFYTLLNIPVTENWNFKAIFGIHTGLSLIFKQPHRDQDKSGPPIEDTNKLSVDGMFIGRGWNSEYRNRGLALWENWAELRFPIAANVLAWDFFFDAAGVKENPEQFFTAFSIEDMRFSFGGGFRFTIPQFPFRFSLAKRFRVLDGQFHWENGAIWGNENPGTGVDFVISFAISTY